MAAPKVKYSKTDPARVTWLENKDIYERSVGYWPNDDKSKPKNFYLGADGLDARERALKLWKLLRPWFTRWRSSPAT